MDAYLVTISYEDVLNLKYYDEKLRKIEKSMNFERDLENLPPKPPRKRVEIIIGIPFGTSFFIADACKLAIKNIVGDVEECKEPWYVAIESVIALDKSVYLISTENK